MSLKQRCPEVTIRYRIYFMSFVFAVLLFYFIFYMTAIDRSVVALFNASLALMVLIEVIYLIRFNRILWNHILTISVFIALLLLTPFIRIHSFQARMWIFILPPLVFFTQSIKNSIIILAIFSGLAALTHLLAAADLIVTAQPYTLEQTIVFLISTISAYIYQKIREDNERSIFRHLFTDDLTGLQNRRKLISDLESASGRKILALINIDNFKEINDLFGTKTGDQVIKHLGELITSDSKGVGRRRAYRLHSDEFAVVFSCNEKRKCTLFAEDLIRALTEPFILDHDEIIITVSIGISDCAISPIVNADIALKKAKEQKKNIVFFEDSLKPFLKYDENRQILLRLRRALQTDNILPYYQPIYNIRKNCISRYEALVRLADAEEVYSPFSFLDISKRAKLYPSLTRIMFNKVFDDFEGRDCSFSINISCDDILNKDTVELIYRKISELDDPSRVIFEMLETERFEECDEVYSFINTVKGRGCRIAVDDFGSGYSNFNYILSLNVDFIKIDASLIKNIDTDYSSQIITKSIISFAREMGIKTIAEYVHNEAVFNKIKELDIDYAQGYFIGRPEPSLFQPAEVDINFSKC